MQNEDTKDLQVELVEWIDSMGMGGWNPAEDYIVESGKSLTCWSAGFVFHEDKDRLSLALSATQGSFNGSITIPKVAVVKRTALAPTRRRSKR
jgi:hypothetical protein